MSRSERRTIALDGAPLGAVIPRAFENAVFALQPGQTTGVLEAAYGFHLFRLEERYEGRAGPFEQAKPALRLAVAERKSTEALAALVAEARKRHPVKVVDEHLPFPYVGKEARFGAEAAP